MKIETFKLTQHTPLIHFQSDDHGATLRASEVKPKLDKFLVKKIEIEKDWIIGDKKDKKDKEDKKDVIALDYGISFIATEGVQKAEIDNRNAPMYFGNTGEKEKKHLIMANGPITLKIKTRHSGLLDKIKEHLGAFFILHNFGTRQNKGYGSFTLLGKVDRSGNLDKSYKTNKDDVEKELKVNYKEVLFNSNNSDDKTSLFRTIEKAYKALKNNPANKRNPSILKKAYNNWEKETTSKFAKSQKKTFEIRNNNVRYVRGLLGLANKYEYPHDASAKTLEISDRTGDIQRFQSPVFFKVFESNIYMVCNDVPKAMLGKEFEFKKESGGSITLKTPDYFDADKLLSLFVNNNNNNNKKNKNKKNVSWNKI